MVEDEQGDFFTAWLGTEGAGSLLDHQPRENRFRGDRYRSWNIAAGAANQAGPNQDEETD